MHCMPAQGEEVDAEVIDGLRASCTIRQRTGNTHRTLMLAWARTGSTEVMANKVVLAYSGGLDTRRSSPLRKEKGARSSRTSPTSVRAMRNSSASRRKRRTAGPSTASSMTCDAFVTDYIWPMLKSAAVYEGTYLLGTSIARPIIAKGQVEAARKVNADGVARLHGQGNDQVRFETTFAALRRILRSSRSREWSFTGRHDLLRYCRSRVCP